MKQNIFLLFISTVFVGLVSQKSYADSYSPDAGNLGQTYCCGIEQIRGGTGSVGDGECCEAGCSYYMKKYGKKTNFSGSCGWVSSSSDNDDGGDMGSLTASGKCCLFDDKTDLDGNLTKECCENGNTTTGGGQTSKYEWVSPVCCEIGSYIGYAETTSGVLPVIKKECCENLDPVTIKDVEYKPVWAPTAATDTTGDAGACCSQASSASSDSSDSGRTARLFPTGANPGALGPQSEICCQNNGGVWMNGYCCLDQGIQLTCLTVDKDGQQVEVPISGCSQISKEEAQAACEAATSANGDFEDGQAGPQGGAGGMPEDPGS